VAKRRSKGSGSVFRRSDGRWSGHIGLPGTAGRKVVYGDSKRDVEERIRHLVNDVADGTPPPSRSPQLASFLQQWLTAVRPTLKPDTYRSYADTVRLHITPQLGRVPLEKLGITQVAGFVAHQLANPRLAPTSARYHLYILRIALNKAVRWGLVTRNVAALVDAPRVEQRDARVLAPDEVLRLLAAARGEAIEGVVLVAVSIGTRLGETLGLQWKDVDLERRQARITKQLKRLQGQGLVVVEIKTRRGRRNVVLPQITAEVLRRHRRSQGELRRLAGAEWDNRDFIFTASAGQPLDHRNVQRSFKRVLRHARMPKMRFHDLRHSCASLLLAQHVDPRVIMETLGHSRISVTMDMYAHVMPALKRDAADAMDRSIGAERE
jgi:integrase